MSQQVYTCHNKCTHVTTGLTASACPLHHMRNWGLNAHVGSLQLPPAVDRFHSPLMAKLLQCCGGSLHTYTRVKVWKKSAACIQKQLESLSAHHCRRLFMTMPSALVTAT